MTPREAVMRAAEIAENEGLVNLDGTVYDLSHDWAIRCANAIRTFAATLPDSDDARDAARYRWLRRLYEGVDFCYETNCGDTAPALIFNWPIEMKVSARLDDTLDAAMQKERA